ncbi:hypothetical protein [Haladaptatus sp. CMAA 1911]|uniref:hypothetical protein n=1 Tax=unclassified Haladaptatus TaxID=2622732 RepID=UPI00375516C5
MSENAVSTAVAQFTESVTNAFDEYTDAPTTVVDEIETAGEQLAEQVDELESSHKFIKRSLWDLEDCVLGDWDPTRPRFEERSIVDQLDEVEEDVENVAVGVEAPKTTLQNTLLAESPLEQVCGMTDDEAKEHLHENQYRATRVALIAKIIGKKTPKGYVVSNKKLREELASMLGEYPNDGTVKRVRDFLDDMGKEHVRIIDHRGAKKVVFDKAFAKRLGADYVAPEECLVVQHKKSWRDILDSHVSCKEDAEASVAT